MELFDKLIVEDKSIDKSDVRLVQKPGELRSVKIRNLIFRYVEKHKDKLINNETNDEANKTNNEKK